MTRQTYSSGTRWEALAGYSRGIRVGNHIHIAGTTATDDEGNLVGNDDPSAQTRYIIEKIERALQALGGELTDVIRTRIFVKNIEQWQAVAEVHGEFFADIRPVNTLVEARLVGTEYLVEIEAEALVEQNE